MNIYSLYLQNVYNKQLLKTFCFIERNLNTDSSCFFKIILLHRNLNWKNVTNQNTIS